MLLLHHQCALRPRGRGRFPFCHAPSVRLWKLPWRRRLLPLNSSRQETHALALVGMGECCFYDRFLNWLFCTCCRPTFCSAVFRLSEKLRKKEFKSSSAARGPSISRMRMSQWCSRWWFISSANSREWNRSNPQPPGVPHFQQRAPEKLLHHHHLSWHTARRSRRGRNQYAYHSVPSNQAPQQPPKPTIIAVHRRGEDTV